MGAAYWEMKVDEIRRAGWSIGWTAALTEVGKLVHIFDAQKGTGRRYVCRDEDRLVAVSALQKVLLRESVGLN